ncbi:hypothetical protein MMC21_008172 [Puttea exsequens]|nr:hypothetical protein [Puttea exsequens]
MTYSTQIARHVGYENIGGTDADKAWWKQTGAVWVISIVTEDLVIGDFALLNDAFNNTMPVTKPAVTWSVNEAGHTSTAEVPQGGCTAYSLRISGEYPCAANTMLNPPQCSNNPIYELSQQNWINQNVDQMLYDWWFNYKDDCDLDNLGHGLLEGNPGPPDTTKDPMSELAYWAFNIQEFSCTMAAGPKACLFTTDSCLYKNVPPWAFLALNAGANLGQNFRNIDQQIFKGSTYNGFLAGTVIADFTKPKHSPDFLEILIMIIVSAIVTCIGIFAPVLIPELAVAAVVAEEGGAEIVSLLTTAIRVKEAILSPIRHIGKSAPFWLIVPGTLMAGATGAWSKIVGDKVDPTEKLTDYTKILADNWNMTQLILEDFADSLFSDPNYSSHLMLAIFGGIYVTAPQYKMDDMFKAMSNDVLARMLNNIFAQYQTYIQFTDLGDGDSQSKCKADTHGPQKSKYCADGGVYYVQSIQKGIRGPQADMPYAYSHLEENGIIPFWMAAASAKVYREYGIGTTFDDPTAFDASISEIIADGPDNIATYMGQLPGEWTLPVCNGGGNYYGWDWVTGEWKSTGNNPNGTDTIYNEPGLEGTPVSIEHIWTPCACGFQGNETHLFWNQTGALDKMSEADMDSVLETCRFGMESNNNQGWLQLDGGPPHDGTVVFDDKHTLTYTSVAGTPTPGRFV